jgi:hypothetical protein
MFKNNLCNINNFLVFLIIILLLLRFFKSNIIKDNITKDNINNINIIISRYNEDLKWTLLKPFNKFNYIVYNKGEDENFEKSKIKKIIKLNNVGREGHTYLYHIINNYNNLADINIFLPGSLELKYKLIKAKNLLYKVIKYNKAFLRLTYIPYINKNFYNYKHNDYESSSKFNKNKSKNKVKLSNIRPFGNWYKNHFGNTNFHYLSNLGILSIDKRDILNHPISYYIKFITELQDDSKPEVGFFFEISMYPLFSPLNNTIIEINYFDNIVFSPQLIYKLPDFIIKNYIK